MTSAPETPPEGFAERNRDRFERARAAAGPNDMVCGTVAESGEPLYFVVPRDWPDHQVEEKAFEVRNGRPMLEGERILLRESRAMRGA